MLSANLLLAFATVATASNHAIHDNPSDSQIGLTTHGSDWLWAVFAVMLISDLVFISMMMRLPRGERVFHHIPIMILTTASIAYFSLASNLGQAAIRTEFRPPGVTRSIWYVRYIDWVITTPLLLLELLLATGLSLSDIVTTIFFDIAMIIVGLVGALVASSYKWGYFTLGMFFLGYIWWILLGPARTTAGLLGTEVRSAYLRSAMYLAVLWTLYPIAWGLAEGSNTISITGEMVFYGILDILAKPVFCFMHISALRNIPYSTFGLTSGKFTGLGNGGVGVGGVNDMNKDGRFGERNGLDTSNGVGPAATSTGGGLGTTQASGHNKGGVGHNDGLGHHGGVGHDGLGVRGGGVGNTTGTGTGTNV